jgi:hypothetical protein
MHIDHGLLYALEHLCLHSHHLVMSRRRGGGGWVGTLVVLPIVLSVIVGGMVHCVDHLKYEHL